MKSFHLEDKDFWENLHFTNKLQDNLRNIFYKYGSEYIIFYKKHKIPIYLIKSKSVNKKIEYFHIKYASKSVAKNKLYPFSIIMYYNIDNIKPEDVNDVYIMNINNIEKDDYKNQNPISGSDIVEFVLTLLRKFGVRNVYLNDGAGLKCENQERNVMITPFKLLEKKRSFYMKFGFKPILPYNSMRNGEYKSIETFIELVNKSIKRLSKVKIENIRKYNEKWINILNKIYSNNDYENVELHSYYPEKYWEKIIDKKNNKNILDEYHTQCIELNKILPKSGTLINFMKKLFYKSCIEYKLLTNVLGPSFGTILYKNKYYKPKYKEDISNIYKYLYLDYMIEL